DPHNFPPPSNGPFVDGQQFDFGNSCWNGYWDVSGTWEYVITAGGAKWSLRKWDNTANGAACHWQH
ncbi:MAG TPA: hypothetical protein VFK45_05225, partial [Gammaproteobacteria bacterium]|nr:hypothetical protein [Gammaproteobacteria bacterium]